MSGRVCRYITCISYTLYLIHYPILSAFDLAHPRAGDINSGSWMALAVLAITIVGGITIDVAVISKKYA